MVLDPPDQACGRALDGLVRRYAGLHRLSGRETVVLGLGARGLHRKGTADCLGCSTGTIDTYWTRILRKTQLRSQAEVICKLLLLALHGPRREAPAEPFDELGPYGNSRQDRQVRSMRSIALTALQGGRGRRNELGK
jgi:DNA-binding CsgD family transcriptional regulator